MTEVKKTLREWEAEWRGPQAPEEPKDFGPFLCPECAGTSASHFRINNYTWEKLKESGIRAHPDMATAGYFFIDRALQCDDCGHLIPESLGTIGANYYFCDARMKWQTSFRRFEKRDLEGFSPLCPVPSRSSAGLLAAADKLIAKKWEEAVGETNKLRKVLGSAPVSGTYEDWISGKHDDEDFSALG